MRSTGLGFWVVCLGFSLAACTSDTTPAIYMEMGWQVRCIDCGRSAQDDVPRTVKNVSGEAGFTLDCDVRKVSGTRRVDFSIDHPSTDQDDKYGIAISLGNLDTEDTEDVCVRVYEGDSTYTYECPSEDASFANPCKASFTIKDKIIEGDVKCDNVPNQGTNEITRSVVTPGSRTDAAHFKLYGCAGL